MTYGRERKKQGGPGYIKKRGGPSSRGNLKKGKDTVGGRDTTLSFWI